MNKRKKKKGLIMITVTFSSLRAAFQRVSYANLIQARATLSVPEVLPQDLNVSLKEE